MAFLRQHNDLHNASTNASRWIDYMHYYWEKTSGFSLSLSPSRLLEYFIYKMRERASAGEPSFSRIISVFTKPDTRHAVRINKLSYPSLVDISSFFSLLLVTCKYRAEYHPLGALKSCKEYNSDRLVEMKNMKRVCQCRMIREEKKRRKE